MGPHPLTRRVVPPAHPPARLLTAAPENGTLAPMTFPELAVHPELVAALARQRITIPTAIQVAALPVLLRPLPCARPRPLPKSAIFNHPPPPPTHTHPSHTHTPLPRTHTLPHTHAPPPASHPHL